MERCLISLMYPPACIILSHHPLPGAVPKYLCVLVMHGVQALTHLESIYGERHWLYVSAMHNLALCYESAGRLADAQATMEKVLALRLKMFGPRHFLYAGGCMRAAATAVVRA